MEQVNEYADEIDLRQYIEVLWRGKWIITAVTLCAMASAGTISFFMLDPVYESSAVITVSLPEEVQASLGDPAIASVIGGTPQVHIRLLQDPVILERAAASLTVPVTPTALARKVTAKAVGDTGKGDRLVEVTARDAVPDNAQAMAEAVVGAYRGYLSDLVSARLSSRRQMISTELASRKMNTSETTQKLGQLLADSGGTDLLREEINARTAALTNYRWEHAQLASEAQAASESLRVLEQQLASIPQTVSLRWSSGTTSREAQSPEGQGVVTATQINPAYTSLMEEVSRKRAALADIEARLRVARDAIPALEAELRALQTRLVKESTVEESLKGELEAARSRSIDLANTLQTIQGQEPAAIVNSAIAVVAPASLPVEPSGPRKLLNIAIAGVLGAMVSVFVVFVMHYWQSTQPATLAR
ncbi:MAG: Wzz/FepE/Etk N-terminal domain-containing protein [Bacillota bacterium]|nr:Wzz/FepE/Etk N-terminal domain-containing protein [Bacillota bacterium]